MGETISYQVNGIVPELQQPTPMSCWATVNTMLTSWKNNQSYSIESVMDWLGSDFRSIYDADTGLPGEKNKEWADANGMTIEYERCETPDSILSLLENYGPLIVIDDENNNLSDSQNNRLWCVHARIIKGIEGDTDDADNVLLNIVDPASGTSYQEKFTDFESKYEAMAGAGNYNILMMHY